MDPAKALRTAFDRGDLRYLPLAVFLFSLPFAHTVALRLWTLGFAAAIVLADALRDRRFPSVPIKLPLALWAAMALASLAWSGRPLYSLREIRNEIGYSLVTFIVCYAMAEGERAWRIFVGFLVASFIAVSVVGMLWSAAGYDQLLGAPFNGVGHDSTYLVMILPLLMVFALDAAARYRFPANALALALPLLLLYDGYRTANRAFWPAVIVCVVVFALLYALRAPYSRVKLKAAALAAAIVIVAATAFTTVVDHRARLPADHSMVDALAQDPRLPLWAHAVAMIEQRPLTGGGFGRGIYARELNERFETPELWHGHNLFLNYALQLGIGGVLVLVILLGAIGREFWRLYRAEDATASLVGTAGVAMLAGFLAKNFTDDFFVRQNALMFWSIVGLVVGYGRWRIRQLSMTRDTPPPQSRSG